MVDNAFDRLTETYRYAERTPAICAPIAAYLGLMPHRAIRLKLGQKFRT
jgi:hypothetical protein